MKTRLLTLTEMMDKLPNFKRYTCPKCHGQGVKYWWDGDIEPLIEACEHCQGYGELFLEINLENNEDSTNEI